MKAETKITLEAKECKQLIAKALGVPEENIVSLKYNFGVVGIPEARVAELLKQAGVE